MKSFRVAMLTTTITACFVLPMVSCSSITDGNSHPQKYRLSPPIQPRSALPEIDAATQVGIPAPSKGAELASEQSLDGDSDHSDQESDSDESQGTNDLLDDGRDFDDASDDDDDDEADVVPRKLKSHSKRSKSSKSDKSTKNSSKSKLKATKSSNARTSRPKGVDKKTPPSIDSDETPKSKLIQSQQPTVSSVPSQAQSQQPTVSSAPSRAQSQQPTVSPAPSRAQSQQPTVSSAPSQAPSCLECDDLPFLASASSRSRSINAETHHFGNGRPVARSIGIFAVVALVCTVLYKVKGRLVHERTKRRDELFMQKLREEYMWNRRSPTVYPAAEGILIDDAEMRQHAHSIFATRVGPFHQSQDEGNDKAMTRQ